MSSNPLGLGGGYAGPGGPHDRHGVVVDATNAVLLDDVGVVLVHLGRGGVLDEEGSVGLTLSGRVNQSAERARVLFLTDKAGAAQVVAELFGLAVRGGFGGEFDDLVTAALARLDGEGAL